MVQLNMYLNFKGQTEAAFEFYRGVFGGQFTELLRFGDMPANEGMPPMTEAIKQQIMHVSLPIGANVLMGTDAVDGMGPPLLVGNNVSLSISPDSEAEAKRIFEALAVGGQITMPLAPQFWNALFGMLTDAFGVNWMVNYDLSPTKQVNEVG